MPENIYERFLFFLNKGDVLLVYMEHAGLKTYRTPSQQGSLSHLSFRTTYIQFLGETFGANSAYIYYYFVVHSTFTTDLLNSVYKNKQVHKC